MSLEKLKYERDSNYLYLPDWALFYHKLGSLLPSEIDAGNRTVIGLAIPTRAFAAVIIAAAHTITKFMCFESKRNAYAHFEWLCTLKKGTSLSYVRNNKKLRAVFAGVDEFNGQKKIRVQTIAKAIDLVPPEKALSITVAKSKLKSVPKKQNGKEIDVKGSLLGGVLSKEALHRYTTNSRLECVIVGQLKVLRRELTKAKFYFQHSRSIAEGTFQEILRVQRFLGSTKDFRSAILPSGSKKIQEFNKLDNPGLVIFDGSSAFMRWREKWRNSDWIVLLDRTDAEFGDAVDILNRKYIDRIKACTFPDLKTMPKGIELIAFEERR